MVPAAQKIDDVVQQYSLRESKPELIVNSSDIGSQQEKDISTIVQYVPTLLPYETQDILFSEKKAEQMLFLDRGFPSYVFVRVEWQPSGSDDGKIPRASIDSIQFRLFNQENTYTSKLTEDELYHICHKNCHKYCGFQDLWEKENAILLSLYDLGLMTEKYGYPYRKRLELKLNVTWNTNSAIEAFSVDMGEDQVVTEARKVRLRTVLIYENGEFVGDIRRSEFVERYV